MKKLIIVNLLFLFLDNTCFSQDKKMPATFMFVEGNKFPEVSLLNLVCLVNMETSKFREMADLCNFDNNGLDKNCYYYSNFNFKGSYIIYKCDFSVIVLCESSDNPKKYFMDDLQSELKEYYSHVDPDTKGSVYYIPFLSAEGKMTDKFFKFILGRDNTSERVKVSIITK